MSDIQVGDVVRLKSGGPKMTIHELGNYGPVSSENGAKCVWFEGTRPVQQVFDVAVLAPDDGEDVKVASI